MRNGGPRSGGGAPFPTSGGIGVRTPQQIQRGPRKPCPDRGYIRNQGSTTEHLGFDQLRKIPFPTIRDGTRVLQDLIGI